MIELTSLKEDIKTEPYPGLRAFQYNEAHLFFGRDEQVDKLLEKLQGSHFVAVIGPSGCGKSSLVKAGLIPALKTGFIIEAGSKWRIAEMRPGDRPFYNLSRALSKSFKNNAALECIKAELKRSPRGLVEFLHGEDSNNENFLLIVDQFEELFRYKQNNNIDEVTAFIALLIESAKQRGISLHIIITMRSDFLGDCSLFPGLPEILNDNQFLTPRLTREQTKEAIEGPALVCGGNLDPQLVNTLLNDIGVDHDQLPLLQHALMRMWSHAKEKKSGSSFRKTGNGKVELPVWLDLDDYAAIGKLNNALSKHANLIYDHKLTLEQQKITEILFRRLSERNTEQKDIRRPSTIRDIAAVAEVSTDEVIEIASLFMAPDYNFLVLSSEGKIEPNSYIDIAHESIMRQWDKMADWIAREYVAASRYKRLVADAEDYERKQGGLLAGIDLENVFDWKKQDRINKAWALRYSDKYELVKAYINESKNQRDLMIRDNELKNRKRKRLSYTLYSCLGLLLISLLLSAFRYQQEKVNSASKYNEHLKKVGDRLLTTNLALKANLHFQEQLQKALVESNNKGLESQKKTLELEAKRKLESLRRSKSDFERSVVEGLNLQLKTKIREKDSTINVIRIQNLQIYSELNVNDRKLAITDLLPLYPDEKTLQRKALIDSVNYLLHLKESTFESPAAKFLKAREIWRKTNTPLIKSLISQFINGNVFYKAEIPSPDRNNSRRILAISNDKKNFVIRDHNNYSLGNYLNDTLNIASNFTDKKDSSSINPGDNGLRQLPTSLDALVYTDSKVTGVEADGRLSLWDTRETKKTYIPIPYDPKVQQSLISPDGNYLVIAPIKAVNEVKDRSVKLLDILKQKETGKASRLVLEDNIRSGIKNISFSSNNLYILVLYADQKLKIWNTKGKNLGFDTTIKISSASFSPSGNHIIVLTEGKGRVLDMTGRSTDYKDFKFNTNYFDVSSLVLSPDCKQLVAIEENGNAILYQTIAGDSIISKEKGLNFIKDSTVIAKSFATAGHYFNKVEFLNDNALLTSSLNGSIFLWKTYPSFSNIEKAFSTIEVPPLMLEERIEEDSLFFKRILAIDDVKKLDSIAAIVSDYYSRYRNDAYYIQEADRTSRYGNLVKDIYKKLVKISSNDRKNLYRNKIIAINQTMIGFEENKDNPDHRIIVEKSKENTSLGEDVLKIDSSIGVKSRVSNTYWNLSWNMLFVRDFAGARYAALRSLELYPDNNGVNTNLALAYLLEHKFSQAEAIYREFKGKLYTNRERLFTTSFLQDLEDLEAANIISQKDSELYKKVQEIRRMLRAK